MADKPKYSASVKSDYLEVIYHADFELTDKSSKEIIPEIFSRCKEAGFTRLLVLTQDAKNSLSPADTINSADQAVKIKIHGFKIAVVKTDSEFSPQSKFAEQVAENRGIILKYFSFQEDALKWLME